MLGGAFPPAVVKKRPRHGIKKINGRECFSLMCSNTGSAGCPHVRCATETDRCTVKFCLVIFMQALLVLHALNFRALLLFGSGAA